MTTDLENIIILFMINDLERSEHCLEQILKLHHLTVC